MNEKYDIVDALIVAFIMAGIGSVIVGVFLGAWPSLGGFALITLIIGWLLYDTADK